MGRSYPGVVFIQYDATKSRDRSHYERFCSYHQSFYRFVEPTGATPFSKPARERALHSVLTAMLRQKAGLYEDKDAMNFDEKYLADSISDIEAFIVDRVKGINERSSGQSSDNIEDIQKEMQEFFDTWQRYVDECETDTLYFGRKYMVTPPAAGGRRLLRQYHSQGKDEALDTLTSMRNVDTPVEGSLIIWGDENA